jgi:hypothetical protein
MAAEKRKITIYNTVGQNKMTIESDANVWGQLQTELHAKGIKTDNMKVVIGETQNSLESPQGSLMAGEFTLFMMPQKVKSGNIYQEIELILFKYVNVKFYN